MSDNPSTVVSDHAYWTTTLQRIAAPVLAALAERKLRLTMPVEVAPGNRDDRRPFTYLEALGRTLCGIAPWLESKQHAADEVDRSHFADLARAAIDAGTDPASPDFMNFTIGSQPLVDAAFLCQALIRAPVELWQKLEGRIKTNVIAALKCTRNIPPHGNNWVLFSAMVEAAMCAAGQAWNVQPVQRAIDLTMQWYKGDGVYGDGPTFHWDYYNSFVIQPMLLDVLDVVGKSRPEWSAIKPIALDRARRYAAIQERLISPEGTFSPIGRSITYRFGALQVLGMMALRHQLPPSLSPGQVRCAMTAVIRRMIEAPGTFDEKGFLRIGFCGHQPNMAESYISTGSLYLCTAGLLPLGLPPTDEFWTCGPTEWTSARAWSGQDIGADHAIKD